MIDNDFLWFKNSLKDENLVKRLKEIKLIVLDIDGSLTDALVFTLPDGEEIKGYSVQDGFAISQIMKNDLLKIALLSGKNGKSVELRAAKLKIPKEFVFLGVDSNKSEVIRGLQAKLDVKKSEILLFGDDILDLEAKNEVGMFVCPKNSLFYVKAYADLLIDKNGGFGALRMLLDLILFVQGKHFVQSFIEKLVL